MSVPRLRSKAASRRGWPSLGGHRQPGHPRDVVLRWKTAAHQGGSRRPRRRPDDDLRLTGIEVIGQRREDPGVERGSRQSAATEGESDTHPSIPDTDRKNGFVQIRTATPHDAPVVRSIIHEVYVGGGWADPQRSPSYVAELLDAEARIAGATVLVAEDDGRAIGTATATRHRHIWPTSRGRASWRSGCSAWSRPARGKGVARALMGWCEKLAVERGMQAVVLTTEPNMTQARRLYEGLGYLRTPQRDLDDQRVGLITYRRDLSKAWPE